MTDLFADLPAEATGPLRARLAAAAAQRGLLDVAYRTLDSPLGSLLLAATPAGLVTIAYAVQDHDAVLASLATRISPRVIRTGLGLDETARQIDEYFAGRRHTFDTPIDLQLARGFRRTVLQHLRQVGYGTTTSYAGLAAAAGSPNAVRAVGTACATNPLPIVLPCHRVIRSDGSPGHYVGGDAAKTALLALETSQETR
ncbi:methylated-DNA--[protein]-cysteine S-methyltransferase [Geodermatophilus ruber]|uniref:methylated-DNA--[protein]-cysteine S-methyltransferase n=1 Tax=Geodermatophilus ruber TaxID=504800 RepID=A0A1I4EYN5_9ACTN|nr:methylated-DNA--[protein]-cysteine S-methyltransferase [Geodermatophilus ruber]SFL09656.1 methylated-DNA-[protein]-cysteine S-methyltransferase [Geodermatophilus ruber]